MAYGKRQLRPPALPAAAAPAPGAPPAPAARTAIRRGTVRDVFVPSEQSVRARMTLALVLIVAAAVIGLAELGSATETAWIGIPGLLVLLAGSALGLRRALRDRRHLQRSATAPGTVTGAVQTGGFAPSIRPTIRFTSADGASHEVAATFPERALHEGRQLTVRYDESDPSWVVLDGDDFRRSLTMVRFVAALTAPVTLALVVAIARLAG